MNDQPIDRFTIGHAAVGVGLGVVGMPLIATVAVAIGWELSEAPLKRRWPELFPHPSQDTPINSLLDAGAMVAGWWAGQQMWKP